MDDLNNSHNSGFRERRNEWGMESEGIEFQNKSLFMLLRKLKWEADWRWDVFYVSIFIKNIRLLFIRKGRQGYLEFRKYGRPLCCKHTYAHLYLLPWIEVASLQSRLVWANDIPEGDMKCFRQVTLTGQGTFSFGAIKLPPGWIIAHRRKMNLWLYRAASALVRLEYNWFPWGVVRMDC